MDDDEEVDDDDEDFEDEDKTKVKQENENDDSNRVEMQKSIERAKLRRAEEEKRLIEQTKAKCAEKLRLLDMKKSTSEEHESTTATATSSGQNIQIKQNVPGYAIRPPPVDLLSSTTKSSLITKIADDHYDPFDDNKQ